jgi:hypothetical protein
MRQIGKAEQVNILCSVWNSGLSPGNVVSGFRKTGIFPVDRAQYDWHHFHPLKLDSYRHSHPSSAPKVQPSALDGPSSAPKVQPSALDGPSSAPQGPSSQVMISPSLEQVSELQCIVPFNVRGD